MLEAVGDASYETGYAQTGVLAKYPGMAIMWKSPTQPHVRAPRRVARSGGLVVARLIVHACRRSPWLRVAALHTREEGAPGLGGPPRGSPGPPRAPRGAPRGKSFVYLWIQLKVAT